MKDKPTRQELEIQISELKRQNEELKSIAIDFHENERFNTFDKENLKEVYVAPIASIFNNMGDSVFVKDDQSRLVLVNDAFCELFQLTRAEIIGKTLAENVPIDERESFLKIDRAVLTEGIENINEETLTINNETKIISTRKSRFIDSNGNKFLVGAIRDITEKKNAEKALKENENKYRKLNATKDKLLSIIAHDLRSPFNNIIGLSSLLQKRSDSFEDKQSEKYIEIINSTAKETLILLDNLLNWAKSQTGELNIKSEKISLSKTIEQVISLENKLAATKEILLKYKCLDEIKICTDQNILKIVLRNLISNAIKFTKNGGKINVVSAKREGGIEISIEDDGVGMSKKTVENLFDIYRTKTLLGTANEVGTGLGLALSKEFVNKLGGEISVISEVGKGSKFTIFLPFKLNNSE
ncbi:PAS domain-containing sensor histidine kinase [Cyclobacterium marinum]|uniref:histidine kinase n=1 Tax=Cyclobacterium marinum (strain ATCC 25205 / DSM 745 / LMG 13164 / NCIMB 1802) TaxID=880070 RepID=G0J4B7_CYCMS|nr:PAS domain-containing sensor histidine kinase [Cyclobacterium marinum]AEL27543.1 PAS/PAC sensor signal transduction histidine kinase [Cyclobacterium marinum DSM 745]